MASVPLQDYAHPADTSTVSQEYSTVNTDTFADKYSLAEDSLERLAHYNTIVLLDDSRSMYGKRWDEARSALRHLGKWASQYDKDGIDIYFLNHRNTHGQHGYHNLKNANEILGVLEQVSPSPGTPLGERMREILGQYLKECGSRSWQWFRSKPPKSINVLVITDADRDSKNNLEDVIINAAVQLDKMHMPSDQVGISFVQIGNDAAAAEYLRALDDDLAKRGIRDMVDTTPYNTSLSEDPEMLAKVLLGGVDRRVDVKGGRVVVQRRSKRL